MDKRTFVPVVVRRFWVYFLSAVLVPGVCLALQDSQSPADDDALAGALDRRAVLIDISGPIGPATAEFLIDSLEKARDRNAELLVIRMDTPGGLDASTRDMVKAILNSPVPVATFVSPDGARAASAGTYILLASHIAAMSPATNVGAATPVAIIGGNKPGLGKDPGEVDAEPEQGEDSTGSGELTDTMSQKAVNDAVAYIRSLAAKHGRNADWAELAVREAASIPADEALDKGVIDLIAADVGDLLARIDGMTVNVLGREHVLDTSSLLVEQLEPDWKSELLAVITSPTIAYLLLLLGVYGLIFEGYNPGAILPGVVGAICLLIALYAFQMLPVNYAGFALIVLGIILMIAEVMVPSFGALGIGGIISMVVGSIILMDTDVPGFVVSRPLIGAMALASSLGLMAIIAIAVKARQRPVVSGREQLVGALGTAEGSFDHHGRVFVRGENWSAVTGTPLSAGQAIVVTAVDGLVLTVSPVDN